MPAVFLSLGEVADLLKGKDLVLEDSNGGVIEVCMNRADSPYAQQKYELEVCYTCGYETSSTEGCRGGNHQDTGFIEVYGMAL